EALVDDFMDQTPVPSTSQEQNVLTQTFTYRDIQSASIALSEFENLFSKCIFYLSREVPRYSLEFIIRAFGGQVGWDDTVGVGSPFKDDDERITHHIIDRPIIKSISLSRVYVQPQWVYDCINARKLLLTKQYRPGHELPPHMSPFVENKEGDYEPELENEFEGMVEETNMDNEDMVYQMELEAEAAGISFAKYNEKQAKQRKFHDNSASKARVVNGKKRTSKEIEEQEIKELSKIMMTKKQKKLYSKMQYGKKKQEEKVLNLKRKKEELKRQKKNAVSTSLKDDKKRK
ncbi:6292_t:CDS:2, partial [Cetraspora pellucida]